MRGGRILHKEQPLVRARGAVPPHRVVEARERHIARCPRGAVPAQQRLEHHLIAAKGEERPLRQFVGLERPTHAHPGGLVRLWLRVWAQEDRALDVAHVEGRALDPEVGCRVPRKWAQHVKTGRQRAWRRHLRHRHLVFGAVLRLLERRDHRQQRLVVLERVGAARGERPPVAQPLHLKGDRSRRVARAQEVAVHGVGVSFSVNGAPGGDERLGEHLAAKHAAPWHRQRIALKASVVELAKV